MAQYVWAWTRHLALTLGFLVSLAQQSKSVIDAPQCRWTQLNPQPPWERAICPLVIDDRSSSWSPWTHKPVCFRSDFNLEQKYCLYTSSTFRNGRGVSLITLPEEAAYAAAALEDPYHTWEPGVQSWDPAALSAHESSLWEIKDVPGKGKGVFAKRTIQPGEIVMLDHPVIGISMTFPAEIGKDQGEYLLERAAEQLSDPQVVYGLSHTMGGPGVQGVIRTNNYEVNLNDIRHMGLYPKMSRVNHACTPHVSLRYLDHSLAVEMIAFRKIEEGEEITVSYVAAGLPTAERKQLLKNHWGFQCSCSVCSSYEKSDVSDDRRARIEEILEFVEILQVKQFDGGLQQLDALSDELIKLGEVEALNSKFGGYYESVAVAYSYMDQVPSAIKFAQMALEFWILFDNYDKAKENRVRRFLKRLEKRAIR